MGASNRRPPGSSLVELLVAVAILALAIIVALTLYDQARRSFQRGENTVEQQQAARVGFDRIASDIRMAGFNTNPDGDAGRPDEPIEAAYSTALVLRADFDRGDPLEASTPEQALAGAGSAFDTVSTGNDEIRIYVLSRPGLVSGDTLRFSADVGQLVRDGRVETVTIDNVALSPQAPPYTLYRMTLDNDAGRCCSGRFAVRTPLVENVRTLRFRYYDHAGTELVPAGGDDALDSIAMRAAIRRIGVEIEALTRDPDPLTRSHREFALAGDVVPRNLFLMGGNVW